MTETTEQKPIHTVTGEGWALRVYAKPLGVLSYVPYRLELEAPTHVAAYLDIGRIRNVSIGTDVDDDARQLFCVDNDEQCVLEDLAHEEGKKLLHAFVKIVEFIQSGGQFGAPLTPRPIVEA